MFDIDGTLTESFALDSSAFLDALRDVFGFDDVCDDWAKYQHVTDAGILAEVFALRRNRQPRQEEISRIQADFFIVIGPSGLTAREDAEALAEFRDVAGR